MAAPSRQSPRAQAAIRIDSHLDGTSERSLADDVLDAVISGHRRWQFPRTR